MVQKGHRPSLGRGLSALISSTPPVSLSPASIATSPEISGQLARSIIPIEEARRFSKEESLVEFVPLENIGHNPLQPRKIFSEAELNELAQSIKELGVLQPVLLRPRVGDGGEHAEKYEIVAGERRWRAAVKAGIERIPAIIRELSDKDALEISIVENVQREDLNPVEEARAYHRLVEEFHHSHSDIAERVGKDRSSVANMLRLLKLPEEVLGLLSDGKISIGHAKAILGLREPSAQVSLARKVVAEQLSVRELEAIVSRVVVLDTGKSSGKAASDKKGAKGAHLGHFSDVEDQLRRVLGTRVSIRHKRSGRGKIEIEYFSEEELDRVVELLLRH